MDIYAPNSPIWSKDQHKPYYDPISGYAFTGLALGLGAGTIYGLANSRTTQGRNKLDLLQSHYRVLSESSPFSILNTFRVAEFLSPFVSTTAKTGDTNYKFESEFLQSKETKEYLKYFFKDNSIDFSNDYELSFNETKFNGLGTLFAREKRGGEYTPWKVLSEDVRLMEATPYENKGSSSIRKTNTAALAFLQASGFTDLFQEDALHSVDQLFVRKKNNQFLDRKGFIPVPSMGNPKFGVLNSIQSYLGAPSAFGMQRLNSLLKDVSGQIPIIGSIAEKTGRLLGVNSTVNPSTGSRMFTAYGKKMFKIGALYTGLQTVDWARRNFDGVGQLGASLIVSAGIAHTVQKYTKAGSPKFALMAGAASFLGQMVLPGFDQGVVEGIATLGTTAHTLSASLGSLTMMNSYRRTVEGLFPGVSSMEVGALAGIATVGLAMSPLPKLAYSRLSADAKHRLGLRGLLATDQGQLPMSSNEIKGEVWRNQFRDIRAFEGKYENNIVTAILKNDSDYHESLIERYRLGEGDGLNSPIERIKFIKEVYQKASEKAGSLGVDDFLRISHDMFEISTHRSRDIARSDNHLNRSLVFRLEEINNQYRDVNRNFISQAAQQLEIVKAKAIHAILGSSLEVRHLSQIKGLKGAGTRFGKIGTIFGLSFVTHQLITGGLLGSMQDADELKDIYSGRKLVAVKKGRWWEGGGTPFAGDNTDYYRPHAYAQFMNRTKHKAAWGENEDEISPIGKWLRENFTYQLEELNYYRRPYPITGAAFANIPVIGKFLASTIGQFIKPAKLMHPGEYMRGTESGDVEFMHRAQTDSGSPDLAGATYGTPYSPYSSRYIAGQVQYQFRELEGLTGFAKNTIQKVLTGTQTIASERPIIATAASIVDPAEEFWNLNLGGGLFTTEAIRRLLPSKQKDIQEYNPIANDMPYWLPDRYKYGDPYRRISEGHLRLPGSAYEAIHPELKGFSMDDYPDIYKYAILADVAPVSKEVVSIREKLYQRRAEGITSEAENALMDETDGLHNERLVHIKRSHVNPNAYEIPLISNITQFFFSEAQEGIRKAAAPYEYLIPAGFRPFQKLLSNRDPIEEYEFRRLYGTQLAFWDKPMHDWIRPAIGSWTNLMGMDHKPLWRQELDETQAYFDRLEFRKNIMLAEEAEAQGNGAAARRFRIKANKTRYGINPNSSAMSIYMTLPDSEKQFFDAFSMATSDQERSRILSMVPKDHVELYRNIWKRADQGDYGLYKGSVADYDKNEQARLMYELQQKEEVQPPVDWIGWREDVNIDDIQLKMIESRGKDLHDYGFWEKDRRALARKEYLNGSDEFARIIPGLGPFSLQSSLHTALNPSGNQSSMNYTMHQRYSVGSQGYGSFELNDQRSGEILSYINGLLR